MMITSATAGDSLLLEEERMARSRGMVPLIFRMELSPTALESEFEADDDVVLSCERRGISVSTPATEREEDSQRIYFYESLVFNLLTFRADSYDASDLTQISPATKGKALPGFESVMTRIAIRQGTPDGEVCDVAAVDLAKYIVGSRGVVEDKIEMQLGSCLSIQVLTTLRKNSTTSMLSKRSRRPDAPPANASTSESSGDSAPISGADKILAREDSASLDNSSSAKSNPQPTTHADDSRSDRSTANAVGSAQNISHDMHNVSNARSSDNIDVDAGDEPSEEESEDCDDRQHNRIILSDHPFTSIARERDFGEMYVCVCDELWEECPITSTVSSPLPISIWSVQGPEEVDPDEEDDMEDLGDGLLAPKRNIAKLQAAAAGSRTEAGPPALPGIMSPLQKTIIRPSRTRKAITIALAKPLDLSRCTVLRAIQANDQNQKTMIPEPVLSDCDEHDTGSESDEDDNSSSESDTATFKCKISSLKSNEGSSDEEEVTGIAASGDQASRSLISTTTSESAGNLNRESKESSESLENSDSSDGPLRPEDGNNSEMQSTESGSTAHVEIVNNKKITDTRGAAEAPKSNDSQSLSERSGSNVDVECFDSQRNDEESEYLNRILELEAESSDLRLILKKSRNVLVELRNERDHLLEVLQAKNEEEECSATEACSESDRERIRDLEGEISGGGESILKLKEELDLCAREKVVVETELEKLKAEMVSESSLRQENERLLGVILSLKQELDREPGVPEVIEELKNTKSELAAERARSEFLEAELAMLSTPKTPSKKNRGGFFGKSSSSSSKSKKRKEGDGNADSPKSIMDDT